jgi:hypothetical protein
MVQARVAEDVEHRAGRSRLRVRGRVDDARRIRRSSLAFAFPSTIYSLIAAITIDARRHAIRITMATVQERGTCEGYPGAG